MFRRIFLSLFAFSAILLLGAGCTLKFGAGTQGGVFKSVDTGEHWASKHDVIVNGKTRSMGNQNITSLRIDPRNADRVFAGTAADGLYVSEDGGETWTNVLASLNVVDIALDSSSRCVVYVLTHGQIYKTSDCGTTWVISYNETRGSTALTSIESDPIQPEIVYATTTRGDVFKSMDRGTTWTAIYRIPDVSISDLVIDRWDSNLIYVATTNEGIFRSPNKGVSWEDVSNSLKADYTDPSFRWVGTLSQKGGVLFADQKGIYRSYSSGDSWASIPLLTPDSTATILSVGVNPHNDDEIFYSTPSTFYHTTDGGAHWISHPLPSSYAGSQIVVDPYNTSIIYLGTKVYNADSIFFGN